MGGGCRNFTNVSLRQERKKKGEGEGGGGLCLDESEKDIKEAIESAAARRAKLRAGQSAGEGAARRGTLAQRAGVGADPLWRRPRARSAALGEEQRRPLSGRRGGCTHGPRCCDRGLAPPTAPVPISVLAGGPGPGAGGAGGGGGFAVPGLPTFSFHPGKGAGTVDPGRVHSV